MFTHTVIKKVFISSLLLTGLVASSATDAAKESVPNQCEWDCQGWWFPNFDEIFSRSIVIPPTIHYRSSINFQETNKSYTINVDLPGIEKKDISINVVNNVLVIAAQRKDIQETKEKKQQSYSSYHQSIVLPENANINKIDATYKNGVVKITIPKSGNKTVKKILIR